MQLRTTHIAPPSRLGVPPIARTEVLKSIIHAAVKFAGLGLSILSMAVLVFGCASADVNPSSAKPQTGYIDFYADFPGELCWKVEQAEGKGDEFRQVYYNSRPVEGGLLRLAFRPGLCRLRVSFLNCMIETPAVVDVDVQDGRVTPVQIQFSEAGSASVLTKQTGWGSGLNARRGRSTTVGTYEAKSYRLAAVPQPPQAYQPKERVSYAPAKAN